jgi:hypothetical protein
MFSESDRHDVVEVTPSTVDDVYMTTEEVAARWRMDVRNLANMRTDGEGPPFTKPGGGRVLYKMSDILACEARSTRGFSWSKLSKALDAYPRLNASERDRLLDHLKKALKA